MKHVYSIQVQLEDGSWRDLHGLSMQQRSYLAGYLACVRSSPGPRLAHRLVRDDGREVDSTPAVEQVSIGMVAGWPTADQYQAAADTALERARLAKLREVRRSLEDL